MKIAVELHTTAYRGDHSAEVVVAIGLQPGEAVEQLASRMLDIIDYGTKYHDFIVIRLVKEE